MLIITNWPSKKSNYIWLVSPKIQDAAPIFGSLTGSTIGILRSTYALALNKECLEPSGRSWANMHSFPTTKLLTYNGFIFTLPVAIVYLVSSFFLTIHNDNHRVLIR